MRKQLWLSHRKSKDTAVKLGWWISSLVAVLILTLPAKAAQLKFWSFDANRNRLEFTTDQEVRPSVQLVPNPTRLVVDLPGVRLGRSKIDRPIGAEIRSVRVAQFNAQTTRIVIELSPNYTLDPQQVKVRGVSPNRWSVQLPEPQLVATQAVPPPASLPRPTLESMAVRPAAAAEVVAPSGATTIDDVRISPDGLFIRTKGASPQVSLKRSRNKKEINLDVENAVFVPALTQKSFSPRFHGIKSLTMTQVSESPNVSRMTLQVKKNSPDWFASVSRLGGIVLLPKGGARSIPDGQQPGSTISLIAQPAPRVAPTKQLATINRVDLGGSQLLIQADSPIAYTTRWKGSKYQITIRSAKLSSSLKEPRLGSNSALSEMRLKQEDDQTATISAKPARGVRVGSIQRLDAQSFVINLRRSGSAAIARPLPPVISSSGSRGLSQTPLPRTTGRRVVVIDPGHGGPDPGAIGRGGLRETNVVLDIGLEVSRILQRQGVVVYLTRTREVDVDLPPRVALAERVRANVFVSIHANAINLSRPDINGLETYHSPGAPRGTVLARTIHNTILRSLNIRSRGVRAARFYVIRRTSMPAVLVETGFVTGAEDAPKLRNPAWRKQMAQAIARGILNYLSGRTY